MSLREEMPHPPAPRLEAVAAGDEPGPIAAHLEACEACAAYVSRLEREAAAFRARVDPAAFVEAIRARATTSEGGRGATVVWVVGPVVAVAAAVLLWLRVSPAVHTSPRASSSAPSSDVARFKGGLSVAAIRERDGRQERLTGPFEVEPSDRIRIEIAVDREEQVTAGLLSDDGTWMLLQSPAALSVGTHYSDLAARFDDTPTDALLLVGSPMEVERARRFRNFEDVVAWRVKSAVAR
jgi:hypothetical protein